MVGAVVSREQWLALGDEVVLVGVHSALGGGPGRDGTWVDLEAGLSGPPSDRDGRHPLPDPEAFAAAMAAAGIGDTDSVVAHDAVGGVFAARLVWMLRATGHAAGLLDGGVREQDRPLAPPRPRASFSARPWPASCLATADDAADPTQVVLDARPRERYLGAPDPLDPRPGHVPGARSLPCRDNLDADGLLLPADVLRRRFADAGADGTAPVVSYCGSGVTACHTLVVLEHLGLGTGRLYPGSWSQYAATGERPVELG